MCLHDIIASLLVLLGMGLMTAAIIAGRRLNTQVPVELRGRWRFLSRLMVFFNVCYLVFVVFLISGLSVPLEVISGVIMLSGSLFVLVMIRLSGSTVSSLNASRNETRQLNLQLLESNECLAKESRERELVQAELLSAKVFFENVFHNSIPLCVTGTDHTIIDANRAYWEVFGEQKSNVSLKCHDSRPGSLCLSEGCPLERIVAGEFSVSCESVKICEEGRERSFLVTARPFLDGDGGIAGIVESFQEITALKQTESALAEEKERWLVTLESIAVGVVTTDLAGHIVLANSTARHLAGLEGGENGLGEVKDSFRLVDSDDGSLRLTPVENILRDDIDEELNDHAVLVAQDGWERQVSYRAAPIYNHLREVIGVVLVIEDITEKLRIEAEMAKIQKLESIGVLAGGIAHDFNNILTAVMNNLALIRLGGGDPDKVGRRLTATEQAVMQARELTGRFLTFARGGELLKKVMVVDELVRDTVDFALRGSNCRYELRTAEGLWAVEADAGQLRQVVNNLAMNAVQAMPNGGSVKLLLDNLVIARGEKDPLVPGPYVRLTVTDQGGGIPPRILPMVFDPYFTTKSTGSGLGLTMVFSIVAKHGGHVFVDSREGRGAAFEVYLPATSQGVKNDEFLVNEKKELPGGQLSRVLLMDDNPEILDSLRLFLEQNGMKVECAADGDSAIRLVREGIAAGRRYDCLVMDLTVPGGKGGRDAIREILELDPAARVLVSSGYSSDPVMADFRRYGFVGRLVKPYSPDELIGAIGQCLALNP